MNPESAELGETAEEIAYNHDLKLYDVRRVLAYGAEHPVARISATCTDRLCDVRTRRLHGKPASGGRKDKPHK